MTARKPGPALALVRHPESLSAPAPAPVLAWPPVSIGLSARVRPLLAVLAAEPGRADAGAAAVGGPDAGAAGGAGGHGAGVDLGLAVGAAEGNYLLSRLAL